ncbi:hypothetical protein HII13_002643 [Brettanomyces bruxellensis]|nr:hypothetical protein HII13_002643 [Brettanomyces bruxellensis]
MPQDALWQMENPQSIKYGLYYDRLRTKIASNENFRPEEEDRDAEMNDANDLNTDGHIKMNSTEQHYLKKELLNIEIIREFNQLSPTYNDITGLRRFGPPFKNYSPNETRHQYIDDRPVELFRKQFPILRFVWEQYIMTFPFIQMHLKKLHKGSRGEGFFWDKLQELFESWKSKKISNSNDRGELSKRQLALYKLKALFVMLFNSAIRCTGDSVYFSTDSTERNAYKNISKLIGDHNNNNNTNNNTNDETNEFTRDSTNMLDDTQSILTTSDLESLNSMDENFDFIDGLAVNICGVKLVKAKKLRPRKRGFSHYGFIIHLQKEDNGKAWFIIRTYSDFMKFHRRIKLLYPDTKIPALPTKDRARLSFDEISTVQSDTSSESDRDSMIPSSSILSDSEILPSDTPFDVGNLQKGFLSSFGLGSNPIKQNGNTSSKSIPKKKYPRESMRISLRGYLKTLCGLSEVRNSHEFKQFILEAQYTPDTDDMNDMAARANFDYLVNVQHLNFQKETIKLIKKMETSLSALKGSVLDLGMEYVFNELRANKKIETLSAPFRALIQLIELEVASTEYELLIGNDGARETFRSVKRIHSLFPYRVIAMIMRFTNPLQIAKKIIDLFTYQMPHVFHQGKRQSMLQTLFTGMLNDEIKKMDIDTEEVSNQYVERVNDLTESGEVSPQWFVQLVLKKIDEYFNYSDVEVLHIKKNAEYYNMDLLLSILLYSNDNGTKLTDECLLYLIEHCKDGENMDAESRQSHISGRKLPIYLLAKIYFKLKLRRYDRSMLVELWQEPEMIEVTKEVISIFFEPLILLFKKAEMYKYIPIFSKYMGELIRLVEYYQKDYSRFKQTDIVTSFMGLENKYAEYGYQFLHNLYINDMSVKCEDDRIFDSLAKWFDRIIRLLKIARELPDEQTIDMNKLLEVVIPEEAERIKIVQKVDQIIDEIDAKRKYYEILRRQNTGHNSVSADPIDNDYLKRVRNKKLTKNWNKINEHVMNLTNKLAAEQESRQSGLYDVVGINKTDLEEMNLDLKSEPDDAPPDSNEQHWMSAFKSSKLFLKAYRKANSDGSLESDEEFRNLQEWEDVQYRDDIGLLSEAFKNILYKRLTGFAELEATQKAA